MGIFTRKITVAWVHRLFIFDLLKTTNMSTQPTRPALALAALLQDADKLSKRIVELFNQTDDPKLKEQLNVIGPDQITVSRKLNDLFNQYCSETLS